MYTKPSSKYQGDISYKMRIYHYSLPTGQSVKLLHSAADVLVLTRFTASKYLKLATKKSLEHPGTAAPCKNCVAVTSKLYRPNSSSAV